MYPMKQMYPMYAKHFGSYSVNTPSRRIAVPSRIDDQRTAQESYRTALQKCQARGRIPGLQAFVCEVWDRHRHIPSSMYCNPLAKLFDEFDADGDGHLSVKEIESALVSRGVQIHTDQLRAFIKAADLNQNEQIERDEFEPFLYALADADQKSTP